MSLLKLSCPKCNGEMVQGAIATKSWLPRWEKGEPKKTFWGLGMSGGGSNSIPVAMFRCGACGFLEAYAREEFEAK